MAPTKEQLKAAFLMLAAVTEAIREAKRIPSGTLYAMLIGKVDIAGYEKMVTMLKNAGLIEEKHSELIWIGPEVSA
jgi:hypothetical protein